MTPGATRDRLTKGVFLAKVPHNMSALLEDALIKAIAAESAEETLHKAAHERKIHTRALGLTQTDRADKAFELGLISEPMRDAILAAAAARALVIAVDDFDSETLRH